jgi:hypothetical protein
MVEPQEYYTSREGHHWVLMEEIFLVNWRLLFLHQWDRAIAQRSPKLVLQYLSHNIAR